MSRLSFTAELQTKIQVQVGALEVKYKFRCEIAISFGVYFGDECAKIYQIQLTIFAT